MMASTVADNVSRPAAPLSANPSRNPLCLRARTPMIASGYTYKVLISPGLRAQSLPAQKSEARAGCAVLNRMTRLGMPMSQRIA